MGFYGLGRRRRGQARTFIPKEGLSVSSKPMDLKGGVYCGELVSCAGQSRLSYRTTLGGPQHPTGIAWGSRGHESPRSGAASEGDGNRAGAIPKYLMRKRAEGGFPGCRWRIVKRVTAYNGLAIDKSGHYRCYSAAERASGGTT